MDPGQGRCLAELTKEQDPPVSGHHMLTTHIYSIPYGGSSFCTPTESIEPVALLS